MIFEKQKQERIKFLRKYGLTGSSSELVLALESALTFSQSPAPVLIEGGIGTEIYQIAKIVHGDRKGRFVRLDCWSDSRDKLSVDLTHNYNMTGESLTESCRAGSIFLHQVNLLDCDAQRFMRAYLDERQRQGYQVKLIFSTTEPLEKLVEKGTFSEDLFFRMYAGRVKIPALKNRSEDIELIAQDIWAAEKGDRNLAPLHPKSIEALKELNWDCNIMELETFIARLLSNYGTNEFILPKHVDQVRQERSSLGFL